MSTPPSSSLNAAAQFIDRHIVEGRADGVAIECGDRRITYGELAGEVNRAGSMLKHALDVRALTSSAGRDFAT